MSCIRCITADSVRDSGRHFVHYNFVIKLGEIRLTDWFQVQVGLDQLTKRGFDYAETVLKIISEERDGEYLRQQLYKK